MELLGVTLRNIHDLFVPHGNFPNSSLIIFASG